MSLKSNFALIVVAGFTAANANAQVPALPGVPTAPTGLAAQAPAISAPAVPTVQAPTVNLQTVTGATTNAAAGKVNAAVATTTVATTNNVTVITFDPLKGAKVAAASRPAPAKPKTAAEIEMDKTKKDLNTVGVVTPSNPVSDAVDLGRGLGGLAGRFGRGTKALVSKNDSTGTYRLLQETVVTNLANIVILGPDAEVQPLLTALRGTNVNGNFKVVVANPTLDHHKGDFQTLLTNANYATLGMPLVLVLSSPGNPDLLNGAKAFKGADFSTVDQIHAAIPSSVPPKPAPIAVPPQVGPTNAVSTPAVTTPLFRPLVSTNYSTNFVPVDPAPLGAPVFKQVISTNYSTNFVPVNPTPAPGPK